MSTIVCYYSLLAVCICIAEVEFYPISGNGCCGSEWMWNHRLFINCIVLSQASSHLENTLWHFFMTYQFLPGILLDLSHFPVSQLSSELSMYWFSGSFYTVGPMIFTAVKYRLHINCFFMLMLWSCDTDAKSFIFLLYTFKCMRYMDLLNQLLFVFCSFVLH